MAMQGCTPVWSRKLVKVVVGGQQSRHYAAALL